MLTCCNPKSPILYKTLKNFVTITMISRKHVIGWCSLGFLSPPVRMHAGLLCIAFCMYGCDLTKIQIGPKVT